MRLSKPTIHCDNISYTCLVWCWNEWHVLHLCLQVTQKPCCLSSTQHNHTPQANTQIQTICTSWHSCEDLPIIRENMLMSVIPKLTPLIAIRGIKLPVHTACLSSSAFHLHWVSHCWHLQVWCLCYQGMNDFSQIWVLWTLRWFV